MRNHTFVLWLSSLLDSYIPYDVLDIQQAKSAAGSNPYSFLHVDKAEIDLNNIKDIYSPEVYQKAADCLNGMIEKGILIQDNMPCLYIYRLTDGRHIQTGLVACANIEDYINGSIKKHELTRPEKEEDRKNHIKACQAHTGPILMAYRAKASINSIIESETEKNPVYDFYSDNGVKHTVWIIDNADTIDRIQHEFKSVESLYIADGHHRSAAAVDVYNELNSEGKATPECGRYLAVLFPENELNILSYNRIVKDLNGLTENEFFEKVSENFYIMPTSKETAGTPLMPHQFGMLFNNRWYMLTAAEDTVPDDLIGSLDVSVLYNSLLSPVLGIGNPRTDRRIGFVGGKNSISELELSVMLGRAKVAFTLCPTSMEELFAVADSGNIMPPKSTWFEPKLLSGLFVHKF